MLAAALTQAWWGPSPGAQAPPAAPPHPSPVSGRLGAAPLGPWPAVPRGVPPRPASRAHAPGTLCPPSTPPRAGARPPPAQKPVSQRFFRLQFKKLGMQTVRHPSSSLGETRLPGIRNHMPPKFSSPLSWPLPPERGSGSPERPGHLPGTHSGQQAGGGRPSERGACGRQAAPRPSALKASQGGQGTGRWLGTSPAPLGQPILAGWVYTLPLADCRQGLCPLHPGRWDGVSPWAARLPDPLLDVCLGNLPLRLAGYSGRNHDARGKDGSLRPNCPGTRVPRPCLTSSEAEQNLEQTEVSGRGQEGGWVGGPRSGNPKPWWEGVYRQDWGGQEGYTS